MRVEGLRVMGARYLEGLIWSKTIDAHTSDGTCDPFLAYGSCEMMVVGLRVAGLEFWA